MATTTRTVREIALEQPTSIRVFEHYGIDYCCGGRQPLAGGMRRQQPRSGRQCSTTVERAAQGSAPVSEDWSKLRWRC